MKYLTCLAITAALFAGCASTAQLPETTMRSALDPLQVAIAYEVYGLRVDIVRSSPDDNVNGTFLNSQVPSAPISDPSNYTWIGIDIGNGIFYDSNGNMAIDLAKMYDINEPFKIQESVTGFATNTVTFIRQGDQFLRSGELKGLPGAKIWFKQAVIDLSLTGLANQTSIYADDTTITYDTKGLLGLGKSVLSQVSPNHISTTSTLLGNEFISKGEDEVSLGNKFTIFRKGDVIEIQQSSLIPNMLTPIKLIRTATGCFFTDQNGVGHEIKREGDTISVIVNNKIERTFTFLKI